MGKMSRDEHGYVKGGFRVVENKATRLRRDTTVVTRIKGRKLLTSSSKPNAPRLLPMPPDADAGMGTADGSGISLSLIFSKNDIMGDGVEREALWTSQAKREWMDERNGRDDGRENVYCGTYGREKGGAGIRRGILGNLGDRYD